MRLTQSHTAQYSIAMPPDAILSEGVVGRRFVAWLIDAVLLLVMGAALWVVLLVFGIMTLGLALPLLAVVPFLPWIYGTLFIASSLSATPGQMMQDLVVRREDDLGDPGLLRSLATVGLFYMTFWASFVIQVLAIVPLAGRRRLLHDILSGTVVVRAHALRDAYGQGH